MRKLAIVLLGVACVRAMPVPWALRSGLEPVSVCDGGTTNAGEATHSFSGDGAQSLLSSAEGFVCMGVLRQEPAAKGVDWEHVDFVYVFTTDDAGVVQSICAQSVPNAPEASTCLADKLQLIRFDPNQRGRYTVHFVFE